MRLPAALPLAFALLSACAPREAYAPEEHPVHLAQRMSAEQLWRVQRKARLPLAVAAAEAELALRGETASGESRLGDRSLAYRGRRLFARDRPARGAARDCASFPSAAAAQRYFLMQGGPVEDRHGLDPDGDGHACEWGALLARASGKAAGPAPRKAASAAPPVCHTGPRGGTYTISPGGRKDYGGC